MSPSDLESLVSASGRPRVLIVGDLILDRYVSGEVTRISPEAPIPVLTARSSEERLGGAKAMLDDGLYTRFPKPDYALAFHVDADYPTGTLVADPGITYSSSDSVDIVVHGVGAHGASPQQGKDPVVMGAQIVTALQTLVSREISPLSPGVVTVGAFHAGSKHNIISDRAELQITVRSDDESVRKQLLDGIRRIAANVGRMNGMPEERLPEVKVSAESTPVTLNDPGLTARVRTAFDAAFGPGVLQSPPRTGMGAEDFAYFIQPELGVPGVYFNVGGTPQQAFDAAKAGGPPVPGHHSPLFKIDPEPSVRLGTEAMTVAVLDLLKAGEAPVAAVTPSALPKHRQAADVVATAPR